MDTLHRRNSLGYIIGRRTRSSGPEIVWGRSSDGSLIHITEAQSGAVDSIRCECGEPLIAKKGHRLAHHFAHASGSRSMCKVARISAVASFVTQTVRNGKVRLPILKGAFRYVALENVSVDTFGESIGYISSLAGHPDRSLTIFVKLTRGQSIPSVQQVEEGGESSFVIDLSKFTNGSDELLRAAILRSAQRFWLFNRAWPSAVEDEARFNRGIVGRIREQLPPLSRSPLRGASLTLPGSPPGNDKPPISDVEWQTLPASELRRRLFGNKYERRQRQ